MVTSCFRELLHEQRRLFFPHAQVQTKEHYLQWVNKLVNILKGQPHQAQQQQPQQQPQQPQQPQLQQQVLTSSVTEPQQPRAPLSVAAGTPLTNEVSGRRWTRGVSSP